MNSDVIITCAITGDDTKVTKSPHCPITPEQIAASALEAARAGAAIVHIHVRDPETGAFSMATRHYREVVKRIRESRWTSSSTSPAAWAATSASATAGSRIPPPRARDFVSQEERMRHVIELCQEGLYRPDIATLDCGSLNFGDGNRAYVSTPNYLRRGAAILRDLGVKAELEVFDTGNLWFVRQLIKEDLIPAPALIQLCTGIPYGVPADTGHLLAMVNTLPADCVWSSFAIEPHADAMGGAVGTARRQRARRAGGQPVPEPWRLREQCAAGREGAHHHRGAWGRGYLLRRRPASACSCTERATENDGRARERTADLPHADCAGVDRLQRPPARRLLRADRQLRASTR